MIIRLNEKNINACVELASKLWPDAEKQELLELYQETISSDKAECFLYVNAIGAYAGFIQLAIRNDYVEGSETSPVAYVEGIYVEACDRRRGIARELLLRGEAWGREHGLAELASDCELDNQLSIDFHKGYGFEEANRLVCFIKKI